jgi:hypothetical protein
MGGGATKLSYKRFFRLYDAIKPLCHKPLMAISSFLEQPLRIEEGINELSSLCATEVLIGDISIQTVPAPRELGELLLKRANVTLPDAIPCRKVKVFTRKKLVEERRSSLKTNS